MVLGTYHGSFHSSDELLVYPPPTKLTTSIWSPSLTSVLSNAARFRTARLCSTATLRGSMSSLRSRSPTVTGAGSSNRSPLRVMTTESWSMRVPRRDVDTASSQPRRFIGHAPRDHKSVPRTASTLCSAGLLVLHGPGFFGGSAWCDATTVTIVSMDEWLGQHKW